MKRFSDFYWKNIKKIKSLHQKNVKVKGENIWQLKKFIITKKSNKKEEENIRKERNMIEWKEKGIKRKEKGKKSGKEEGIIEKIGQILKKESMSIIVKKKNQKDVKKGKDEEKKEENMKNI